MHNRVTIAMYHYVRDLKYSRYPDIKGLDATLFKSQLDYLSANYNFITMEQLIDSMDSGKPLPEKAVLLTFDDAYIDHFNIVFPILDEKGIQGSFFPPVKAITEYVVLDVNKIHFILASVDDKSKIIKKLYEQLDNYREEYKLESNQHYFEKLAHSNRFDPKEVIFIKRLLQTELPEELRNKMCDELFAEFVGLTENTFSRELYMSVDQIKCMKRKGMHIGAHGYDHYWLGHQTKEKQREEIIKSKDFIKAVGGNLDYATMCYPYGNYNQDTLEVLKEQDFKAAFTTIVNVADIKMNSRFELPRLDTNDLPKTADAERNDWYLKG
jgi:peptidoglycan/xylan/chitin deacetylase (PgdA/CDA1 family)